MRRTAAHTGPQITQGSSPGWVKGTQFPVRVWLEGREVHKGDKDSFLGGGGAAEASQATTNERIYKFLRSDHT